MVARQLRLLLLLQSEVVAVNEKAHVACAEEAAVKATADTTRMPLMNDRRRRLLPLTPVLVEYDKAEGSSSSLVWMDGWTPRLATSPTQVANIADGQLTSSQAHSSLPPPPACRPLLERRLSSCIGPF